MVMHASKKMDCTKLAPSLITGIPRGGTSLVCRLLNSCHNTVALDEPMDVSGWNSSTAIKDVITDIDSFSMKIRKMIMMDNSVISKSVDGVIGENHFETDVLGGLRDEITHRGVLSLQQKVEGNFSLFIKHPAVFAALLNELAEKYMVYSVIRNPISVLLSWNSNRMPQRNGFAPAAMKIDGKLKHSLERCSDRIDRQIILLSWFFERFLPLPDKQIISYESVIESSGANLKKVSGAVPEHQIQLLNRNSVRIIGVGQMNEIVERLLNCEGAYLAYYSREDILSVFEGLC